MRTHIGLGSKYRHYDDQSETRSGKEAIMVLLSFKRTKENIIKCLSKGIIFALLALYTSKKEKHNLETGRQI